MKYLGAPQSGSQANTTASRNRYGQYYRTRATPVNPASTAQTAVRNVFTIAAQQWRALSPLQRTSWQSYAETHPWVDPLGQSILLTGSAWFLKIQAQSAAAGLTPSLSPPADPAFVPGALLLDQALIGGALQLTGVDQPAGYVGVVFAAPPVSPGVSFPPTLRQVDVVAADAWSTPVSFAAAYDARWGPFVAGQKIIVEVQMCSDLSVYGQRIRASTIAV